MNRNQDHRPGPEPERHERGRSARDRYGDAWGASGGNASGGAPGYGSRDDGEQFVPRDRGTRVGEYDRHEPAHGEGAGGRSFRETEFVSQHHGGYRQGGHGYSDFGSGQGFASQDYSRNEYYAGQAPGGRGMGGQGEGEGYGPSPYRQGRDRGLWERGGRSQESYGAGRDFGGQGGYGGGYGESAGGSWQGQSGGGYPGRADGYAERTGGGRRGERSGGYWGEGGGAGGGYAGEGAGYRQSGAFAGGGQSLRGKGPKGWKRSDERIQEDICERLSDDHEIDASDISVSTRDGVVTLEGSVSHRAIKHRVEDIVEQCSGVADIRNNIAVKRAGQTGGSDTGVIGLGGGTGSTAPSGGEASDSSATGARNGGRGSH